MSHRACPICGRGDLDVDDCIGVGEHIPGSTGSSGVFEFKAHKRCVFDVIEAGGDLTIYGPEMTRSSE